VRMFGFFFGKISCLIEITVKMFKKITFYNV